MTTSEKVYQTAISFIGKDASPDDIAPDELACAESVTDILIKAGCRIPIILSTSDLNFFLHMSSEWGNVTVPTRGNIVISPTGMGGKNGITHGHVGILMDNGKIASNDSLTGNLTLKYDLKSWESRYVYLGGYPMTFYALKAPEGPPTEAEKVQIASDAIKVATEAIKTPSLRDQALAILKAVLMFLKLK